MAVAEEKGGATAAPPPYEETYEEYLARQYAQGNVYSTPEPAPAPAYTPQEQVAYDQGQAYQSGDAYSTGQGYASDYAYGGAATGVDPAPGYGLPTTSETIQYVNDPANTYTTPPPPPPTTWGGMMDSPYTAKPDYGDEYDALNQNRRDAAILPRPNWPPPPAPDQPFRFPANFSTIWNGTMPSRMPGVRGFLDYLQPGSNGMNRLATDVIRLLANQTLLGVGGTEYFQSQGSPAWRSVPDVIQYPISALFGNMNSEKGAGEAFAPDTSAGTQSREFLEAAAPPLWQSEPAQQAINWIADLGENIHYWDLPWWMRYRIDPTTGRPIYPWAQPDGSINVVTPNGPVNVPPPAASDSPPLLASHEAKISRAAPMPTPWRDEGLRKRSY